MRKPEIGQLVHWTTLPLNDAEAAIEVERSGIRAGYARMPGGSWFVCGYIQLADETERRMFDFFAARYVEGGYVHSGAAGDELVGRKLDLSLNATATATNSLIARGVLRRRQSLSQSLGLTVSCRWFLVQQHELNAVWEASPTGRAFYPNEQHGEIARLRLDMFGHASTAPWRVVRHGGRSADKAREAFAGDEARARRCYERLKAELRQGSVTLYDQHDQELARQIAYRNRTRH